MLKFLEKLKEERGFTLVEMAIVILIIAGLLLLMITNIGGVTSTATKTTDDGIIQTVETQMVIYEVEEGKAPSSAEELGEEYISKEQLKAYKEAKASQESGD